MPVFPVYSRFDFTPVRGAGSTLYDAEGQAYLDLYGGHAVISIGHQHPHFQERLRTQLGQLAYYSNSVQIPQQTELANRLTRQASLPDHQLFLCNSGAEAVENALKLASFHRGRREVIAFRRSFHGRTSAAVNVTDKESIKSPLNKSFPVSFHSFDELLPLQKQLARRQTAAVIIEGIQGWAGIYAPPKSFLQELQKLCRKYETLLILDEIQSGYGRTGDFFAHQAAGIEADLITVAKGMGNGFPVAGLLIHPRLQAQKGALGTTFGGNHLACAAGLAVLEVIEAEGLVQRAQALGSLWRQQLGQLPGIQHIRGRGLMIGIELATPVAPLRQRLLKEHRILTGSSLNPKVLRLLPALNVPQSALTQFNEALQSVLAPKNTYA
ncbi:MAG: aminotransferase class III-fold pyridoxal phosphate-dependent enzyme [Bacteroidota bacterium]